MSIFFFVNQPYAKENIGPSEKETFKVLEKLKEETSKYKIGTYDISENDIKIDIIGSQEYYDSVKNEVKKLVKNTIRSTPFEKYSIYVTKSEINKVVSKKAREKQRLMLEIATTIQGALSEFYPNQIDQINLENTPTKLFNIKIKTLYGNQNTTSIGKEMESKIYMTLERKLNSNKLIKERMIQINIYNKHGAKIN